MCGIVGMVAKAKYGYFKKQEDTFFELLRMDEIRGEDSTGIIYVENSGDFGIIKDASAASWCMHGIQNHKFLKDSLRNGKALIGHNRKATVGKVRDETAHPFVIENSFAMVHNGTLFGHRAMKDTEVDSEALAHHLEPVLSGDFDQDKFEEELGKVNGAFAVSIFSQKNNKVFLMRNNQRPLAFVETEDSYYWASEYLMLLWILSRNGYDMTKNKIVSVKEHQLISIDLETNGVTFTDFVPKKAPARTIPASSGPLQNITHSGNTAGSKKGGSAVSKNEFKRLRKQWIGTRHSFFVDDYVEVNFPKTVDSGEVDVNLLGGVDAEMFAGYNISVVACVNLIDIFGETYTVTDFTEGFYHGIIDDMALNRATGEITLHMGRVKKMEKSIVHQLTHQGKWNASSPITVH